MSKRILAIDQGTTGTTAALFDTQANLLGKVTQEYRQLFPQPGWVEHDLEDIWESVGVSVTKLLKVTKVDPHDIQAIGITNQRETTSVWERETGKPLHHAIVWQCRRTTPLCQELKQKGLEPVFRKKTGLLLDPYFSGTKLHWLLQHVDNLKKRSEKGEICFGTIDSFLVYRLTGKKVHVTDVSNASRTLLMNLDTLQWDDELLSLLEIPRPMLPLICGSSEVYGTTKNALGLPDGIPVCGIAGDQQAALFGQCCFEAGQVKCTYGTGAFVLMNTGDRPIRSSSGLLTTVGWKIGPKVVYALEGSVFIAGAAVQWLRDGLGLISSSEEIDALAASVDSSEGVVFVPALVGLGAPHWNPNARGIISGITRGTKAAHLARATLEGIAFQVRDVVAAMEKDAGQALQIVRVDGGASQNQLLLQFQADILGVGIHRPKVIETTAMGAAFLAGLAVGIFKSESEIERFYRPDKEVKRACSEAQAKTWIETWQRAIEKA